MTDSGVIYHGYHQGSNSSPVVVLEGPDGELVGALRHIVRHSPDGFSWGYGGSGPSDLARSLLIDAMGEQARCPDCAGRLRVVYEDDGHRPFEPTTDHPDEAYRCLCDDGYRPTPYQDFKWAHVAGWSDEWRMTRADILTWLATHPAKENR